MSRIPLLLLDVDGVIAPIGDPHHPQFQGTRIVERDAPPGRTAFLPDAIARIASWEADGLVDVEWLTTWFDDAPSFLSPAFRLPDWIAHKRPRAVVGTWWKALVVGRALAAGRPVVWMDDDIKYRAEHLVHHPRLLAVSPEASRGLTEAHLASAQAWLEHRQSTARLLGLRATALERQARRNPRADEHASPGPRTRRAS